MIADHFPVAAADAGVLIVVAAVEDDVVAVQLKNKHGQLQLRKDLSGAWTLVTGEDAKKEAPALKKTEIDALLGSISSIQLKEPLGTEAKVKHKLGPEASAHLVVEVQEKAKADPKNPSATPAPPAVVTHTLVVGAKEGDDYFIKSHGSEYVVKAAAWTVQSLVDKKLADFVEAPKDPKADAKAPK